MAKAQTQSAQESQTTDTLPPALVPGELSALDTPETPEVSDNGAAARIAELEATVNQQNAIIADLQAQLARQPAPGEAAPAEPVERVIGGEWANRTAAEAQAAGLKEKVLCRDGWYIP